MPHCVSSAELYYSPLALEPDFTELVELFVRELPGRIAEMRQAIAAGNMPEVARLAHQLKGAGGSYGFPQLGAPSRDLELAARQGEPSLTLDGLIETLMNVASRVRAGSAETLIRFA